MRLASAEAKSSENGCFLPPASFSCMLASCGDPWVSLDPDPSLPFWVFVDGPAPGSPLLCRWWEALDVLFPAPYLAALGLAGASPWSLSSRPAFLEERELRSGSFVPCLRSSVRLLWFIAPQGWSINAGCGISSSGRKSLVLKLSVSEFLCSNF